MHIQPIRQRRQIAMKQQPPLGRRKLSWKCSWNWISFLFNELFNNFACGEHSVRPLSALCVCQCVWNSIYGCMWCIERAYGSPYIYAAQAVLSNQTSASWWPFLYCMYVCICICVHVHTHTWLVVLWCHCELPNKWKFPNYSVSLNVLHTVGKHDNCVMSFPL